MAPLTGLAAQVRAQSITIRGDSVVLEGRLPIDQGLRRHLVITVAGTPPSAQLDLVPRDLEMVGDPSRWIDGSAITLDVPDSVSNGDIDATIEVSRIRASGTYSGAFEVLLKVDDEARDSAHSRLRVIARPRIELSVAGPEGGLQWANCTGWPLTCWWTRVLLHRGVDADRLRLRLETSPLSPVEVGEGRLFLVGELSGETRVLEPLSILPSAPPGEVVIVYPLTRGELHADGYDAHVSLTVDGIEEPVTLETPVDVRAGAGLVTLLLILGIVLARSTVPINGGDGDNDLRGAKWLVTRLAGFRWTGSAPTRREAVVAWLGGVPWSDDKRTEGLLRALTVIVLLAIAVRQGLMELYVNESTFGDTALLDYAGVFLWPLTADVVLRGFGNLLWPRPLTVSLTPPSSVIAPQKTAAFTLHINGGPTGTPAWVSTSSDPTHATVQNTPKGCIATGVAVGTATITVEVTKGPSKRKAEARLEVKT